MEVVTAQATNETSQCVGPQAADGNETSQSLGPSHVLMSYFASAGTPPDSSSFSPTTSTSTNPYLERDYVYKRKRTWSTTSSISPSSAGPFDGVSKVERELVACCERFHDDDNYDDEVVDNNFCFMNSHELEPRIVESSTSSREKVVRGVLAINNGKEKDRTVFRERIGYLEFAD